MLEFELGGMVLVGIDTWRLKLILISFSVDLCLANVFHDYPRGENLWKITRVAHTVLRLISSESNKCYIK